MLPVGCVTKGRKGYELTDFDNLISAGVIGFSDDGDPIWNSLSMRHALERSYRLGLPIMNHCEDKGISEGGHMNEGLTAAKLGIQGIPAEAEEIMIARDLVLARITGGWLHIQHISTKGSIELIRHAREQGIRFTVEVTPHHLTLTDEKVITHKGTAIVHPPLMTVEDNKALIQGLKDNMINAIVTDHAPHKDSEKFCDFDSAARGLSVFETAFGSVMSLVHSGQLDLSTIIAKLTAEPASIIGSKHGKLGSLAIGAPADITVFDPDREWKVNAQDFISKGKATPLEGDTLKGKIVTTIAQGKIVYKDKTSEA
jgi:dihydroorotase